MVGRGIVFVDLALGQISSLGVAFSDYIGHGKTIIPIAFALGGALLMSLITIRDRRLKLEAVIGIIYAVASAATVMLISKTPHGDSDIQEVLFGNILSINWGQITTIGIIFGVIGLVHLIFYKKFFLLTETFENNDSNVAATIFRKNKWFKFWNFIFYISIGLAIVFAVRTSGVIPVFSFLIVPSVALRSCSAGKQSSHYHHSSYCDQFTGSVFRPVCFLPQDFCVGVVVSSGAGRIICCGVDILSFQREEKGREGKKLKA